MSWLLTLVALILFGLWRSATRGENFYANLYRESQKHKEAIRERYKAHVEWWRTQAGQIDASKSEAEKEYERRLEDYRSERMTFCTEAHRRNQEINYLKKRLEAAKRFVRKSLTPKSKKATVKKKVKKLPSR